METEFGSEGGRIETRRYVHKVIRSEALQWLKVVAIFFPRCGGGSWKGEVEIDDVASTLKQMDGQRQVGRYLGTAEA